MNIGELVLRFETLDSTNSKALELLRNAEIGHGAAVVTENQLDGRGQRGRNWSSQPSKNLLVTYVIEPTFLQISDQFKLSAAVALAVEYAVRKSIEHEGRNDLVKVKWPNDIMVGDKKVAGILIENSIQGDHLQNSVVGIGINANQVGFEGLRHAASLWDFLPVEVDLDQLLKLLSKSMQAFYNLLQSQPEIVISMYKENMYGLHQWLQLEVQGETGEFRVLGIKPDGKILTENRKFATQESLHHEVIWLSLSE